VSAQGGAKHLDELTILRLAEGELARDREDVTRNHLIECARCRAGYEALKAETELLRAAVLQQEEALPDHIRPRHADVSWVLVAILVFGTLGASSLWTRYVAPMVDGMESVGLDGTSVATTVLIRSLLWRGWSDMLLKLIQGAVLLTVLVLAGYMLHWAWRRLRSSTATLCLAFAAITGVFGAPTLSEAAVIEHDVEVYTLRAGHVIETDLIVAADEVRIEGIVTGDLIVFASTVVVVGEVQGDVIGFAETIDITGHVGGNVRTGSQRLNIEGVVERNITAVGQIVRLASGAKLGGSFTAGAREVILDAPVPRDVIVAARTTEIHARVHGSALVAGKRLTIGADGGIGGDAKFYGRDEPDVDPDANLASPIDFEQSEEEPERPVTSWVTGFFYFWTAAFIFGAVLMLLTPEATEEIVTKHMPDYGKSFVTGVVTALVLFATGFMVTFTIVGAPLGMTALFVLGVGLYVAQVYVAAYIGREILGTPTSATAGLARLALGLFLVHVAKSIPFVSFIAGVLIALWGFGALASYVRVRFQTTVPSIPAPEVPA
jgi:hypothetical protein